MTKPSTSLPESVKEGCTQALRVSAETIQTVSDASEKKSEAISDFFNTYSIWAGDEFHLRSIDFETDRSITNQMITYLRSPAYADCDNP